MATNCVKVKCMKCGLHFAAYSWSEEWRPGFCPECGTDKGFLVWREELAGEIFQYIPGSAPVVELGA